MKIAIFASKDIGRHALDYILKNHPQDLAAVIYIDSDSQIIDEFCFPSETSLFSYEQVLDKSSNYYELSLDLVILAWWPKIVPSYVYNKARLGAVNTHNSLIPFSRGVHPNYWSIRNDEPYGVSIHRVVDGIDAGSVLKQVEVQKFWEDTGESLYWRGIDRLKHLFNEVYEDIENLISQAVPQELKKGSIYNLKDMPGSFTLDLNESLKVKDVLNRIRAKQFGSAAANFYSGNNVFEVRIEIRKLEN